MSDIEQRGQELIHGLVTAKREGIQVPFDLPVDDPESGYVLAAAVDYSTKRIAELLFAVGEYHPEGQAAADQLWQQVALGFPGDDQS